MKTIKNLTADQIRKSILQLAIQGKLVKQDPNDEPASVLVDKIYEEKKKLIAEGKIKKEKVESRIFKGDDNHYYEKIGNITKDITDELPFEIPDNWTWIRLKNTSEIYNGNSINENEKKVKYSNRNIGYDYISTKDISFGKTIQYDNGVIIPFNTSFRIAPQNKILLCIEGGSAGKKIAFTQKSVCFGNKLACFNTFIINDLYLFYILQTQTFINIFKSSLSGIIGGVSINNLKEFIIPLPPLFEQERIVEKIKSFEPLLEKYNKLENQLTKLESEFAEKLKKSILQCAIEGKLVRQDPNDEPASVLLERIKAEKEKLIKEGKIKRDKNESFIYQGDDKNYYENLPINWVLTTLSAAGNWKSGSTPDRNDSSYYFGNIPWIKTGELNDSLSLNKSNELITEKALAECSLTINKPGNVLVAMYGATIGKLAINSIPIATNQACCGCTLYTGIFNKFLFYFLMANRKNLIELGAGGAQPNISKEKIQSFYLILPPTKEQYRIVDKLENLINIIK